MSMPPLVLLVLQVLVGEVPPAHHAWTGEPRLVTLARYVAVASAIAEAAEEDAEPQSMAILLAVTAAAESALRADVVGCRVVGDGGRVPAQGAFQLARPAAVACDLPTAARAAREELRASLEACPEPLAFYLSGRCDRGVREARRRWRRALRWWAIVPRLPPSRVASPNTFAFAPNAAVSSPANTPVPGLDPEPLAPLRYVPSVVLGSVPSSPCARAHPGASPHSGGTWPLFPG